MDSDQLANKMERSPQKIQKLRIILQDKKENEIMMLKANMSDLDIPCSHYSLYDIDLNKLQKFEESEETTIPLEWREYLICKCEEKELRFGTYFCKECDRVMKDTK